MSEHTTRLLKRSLLSKLDNDAEYAHVITTARKNLPRFYNSVRGHMSRVYLDTWRDALDDREKLKALVDDMSTEGLSLWQLAPFVGVWTPRERWDVLRSESDGDAV